MTIAPEAPPRAYATLEEAIGAIRGEGRRLSTPRRLVLEALFAAAGPVSAAQLAQQLSLDESSVYRNLEVLERHGLVRHVHLGHGPGLYLRAGEEDGEYLYCERCSSVTTVAPEELEDIREQIRERFGFRARFTHFALVGTCERCASSTGG
jgi:Fur family ferric uptake transcriptional regulator